MGRSVETPAHRVRKSRMLRGERREQLLDVAERLFAEQGFDNTSMEDIARTAGVTRPVVYDHYPSKEAMFVECVRRARAELEERMSDLVDLARADIRLADVIEHGADIFFDILERDPKRWGVLFSPSSTLSVDVARQISELRFGTVERIIEVAHHYEPGLEDDLVQAYAHAVSGVGEQMGRWWIANPHVSRARIVQLHRDFIMRGLSPWEASSPPGHR